MLKVIPVEEAVGTRLAHDITEIIPGGHKGPRFRRGHLIAEEDVPRLLDVGKAHLYIMELAPDELHEEDAAKRLARAAAGTGLTLTGPERGPGSTWWLTRDGMLEVDQELLFRFNELGDLILATLRSGEFVREGTVVGGTRTIPVVVKEELVARAEALCKDRPLVSITAMPTRKVFLLVTGSEVLTGRIKDGFEPVVREKVEGMGSTLEPAVLAPDDPDVIAGHIKDFAASGAEIILVSGGMSVDPDDLTPEGIRRSGADVVSHGFPILPGSMFLMSYLGDIPVLGLSGCVAPRPRDRLRLHAAQAPGREPGHAGGYPSDGARRPPKEAQTLKWTQVIATQRSPRRRASVRDRSPSRVGDRGPPRPVHDLGHLADRAGLIRRPGPLKRVAHLAGGQPKHETGQDHPVDVRHPRCIGPHHPQRTEHARARHPQLDLPQLRHQPPSVAAIAPVRFPTLRHLIQMTVNRRRHPLLHSRAGARQYCKIAVNRQ